MGLRDRLSRIERLTHEAIPSDRCTTCGYPAPLPVLRVFVVNEGEDLPRCPTCGRPVDEDGKSVISRGPAGEDGRLKIRIRGGGGPNCTPTIPAFPLT
jgi:Na+-translocating ferredoxin:NAD+ oxidoreductase RNF subunit RnfB